MKLQRQLISAFGVLAAITLAVSLFAFWQVDRLGSALYEVGVVRLPSIQGLVMMNDSMADLDDSARGLLANPDGTSLAREQERQRRAWQRFDEGWNLYEPLPQTPLETIKWREFVPAARKWKTEYAQVLGAIAAAVAARDPVQLVRARELLKAAAAGSFATAGGLLDQITELNYGVAENAKRHSIDSYADMTRIRALMLWAAGLSAISAIAFGVLVGRRISRPVVEIASAFSQVAAGDRAIQVPVRSEDEVGDLAHALNRMVAALRSNEARLRILGDNLPGCMIYQVVREGTKRQFLHVSAGVKSLHGLTPEEVLQDATRIYGQIVEEDRAAAEAAEQEAMATRKVFHLTARIRRVDGAIRWMSIWSQPHIEADGRVVWDGIEMDVTDRTIAEAERERLALAIEAHFDGAYWMDTSNRFIYVNDAGCRAVGYTREELLGQHVSMIAPHVTPALLENVWRRLRTEGLYQCEGAHRRKNGSLFPVEIAAAYVRMGDQEFNCGFARDISERRSAEESLQAQMEELKRWHRLTLERENRVRELKDEINELCAKLGEPPRYGGTAPADADAVGMAEGSGSRT